MPRFHACEVALLQDLSAPKSEFNEQIQGDLGCPDSQAKIFRFSSNQNQWLLSACLALEKRGVRVVTNVGCGMRWTLSARRTSAAARRTVKSRGPDASTLASSQQRVPPLATVARKPDHRGDREGNRKTIAQGMP